MAWFHSARSGFRDVSRLINRAITSWRGCTLQPSATERPGTCFAIWILKEAPQAKLSVPASKVHLGKGVCRVEVQMRSEVMIWWYVDRRIVLVVDRHNRLGDYPNAVST